MENRRLTDEITIVIGKLFEMSQQKPQQQYPLGVAECMDSIGIIKPIGLICLA
jgi:hypothetical protein